MGARRAPGWRVYQEMTGHHNITQSGLKDLTEHRALSARHLP